MSCSLLTFLGEALFWFGFFFFFACWELTFITKTSQLHLLFDFLSSRREVTRKKYQFCHTIPKLRSGRVWGREGRKGFSGNTHLQPLSLRVGIGKGRFLSFQSYGREVELGQEGREAIKTLSSPSSYTSGRGRSGWSQLDCPDVVPCQRAERSSCAPAGEGAAPDVRRLHSPRGYLLKKRVCQDFAPSRNEGWVRDLTGHCAISHTRGETWRKDCKVWKCMVCLSRRCVYILQLIHIYDDFNIARAYS